MIHGTIALQGDDYTDRQRPACRRRHSVIDGSILFPPGGEPPREIIIFLHGVASNGDIVASLAPRLQASFPHALIVAPNAPNAYPERERAYQWWPLSDFGPRSLAAGVKQAGPPLQRFIDDMLAATGPTEDRLVLAGFSQGAMLALHAAITRPRRTAGVVAFSGALAHRALPWRPFGQRPPVLLVHGAEDTVIPLAALSDAARKLTAYGCRVEAHVRAGLGHSVNGAAYALAERAIGRMLGNDAVAGQ